MGNTAFLTKGLRSLKTKTSLAVLAYNMKRMIRLFSVRQLLQALSSLKRPSAAICPSPAAGHVGARVF